MGLFFPHCLGVKFMFRWLKEYWMWVKQGRHHLAITPTKRKQAQKVMGLVFQGITLCLCQGGSSDKCSSKYHARENCVLLWLLLFILPYFLCATVEYKNHIKECCWRTGSDLQMSKPVAVTYAVLIWGSLLLVVLSLRCSSCNGRLVEFFILT